MNISLLTGLSYDAIRNMCRKKCLKTIVLLSVLKCSIITTSAASLTNDQAFLDVYFNSYISAVAKYGAPPSFVQIVNDYRHRLQKEPEYLLAVQTNTDLIRLQFPLQVRYRSGDTVARDLEYFSVVPLLITPNPCPADLKNDAINNAIDTTVQWLTLIEKCGFSNIVQSKHSARLSSIIRYIYLHLSSNEMSAGLSESQFNVLYSFGCRYAYALGRMPNYASIYNMPYDIRDNKSSPIFPNYPATYWRLGGSNYVSTWFGMVARYNPSSCKSTIMDLFSYINHCISDERKSLELALPAIKSAKNEFTLFSLRYNYENIYTLLNQTNKTYSTNISFFDGSIKYVPGDVLSPVCTFSDINNNMSVKDYYKACTTRADQYLQTLKYLIDVNIITSSDFSNAYIKNIKDESLKASYLLFL